MKEEVQLTPPPEDAHQLVLSKLGSDPWRKIDRLERKLAKLPPQEFPLHHIFTPGLYLREICMPKGSLLTSQIHLTEHPFVISMGLVSVFNEGEWQLLGAPFTGITKPGTRRILYTHEDTIWTTCHVNPKNLTSPGKIAQAILFSRLKLNLE